MSGINIIEHRHEPVYRVVRQSWPDPLDASYSQSAADNRWNTEAFPALYCCCSEEVARVVTRDRLRFAGVEVEELQPDVRPSLVEISWNGPVIDLISAEGLAAAGFFDDYPARVDKAATRKAAARWHHSGIGGVVVRSASAHRLGRADWQGPHENWSEMALFIRNCAAPRLLTRRANSNWLYRAPAV